MKLRAVLKLIPADGEARNWFSKSFQLSVSNTFLDEKLVFFSPLMKNGNWESSGQKFKYGCSENLHAVPKAACL